MNKLPKLSNGGFFGWKWSLISLIIMALAILAVFVFDIDMRDTSNSPKSIFNDNDSTEEVVEPQDD